ncbi:MAG: hypothetical protein ACOX9E_07660 [Lentisphaeria bacterium]
MRWRVPWKNEKVVKQNCGEVTPFFFKNRYYLLENFFASSFFYPGHEVKYRYHEDGFLIRDMDSDRIISIPLLNHYFASAIVHKDRVHVFAADYGVDQPWWKIKRLIRICSDDLVTWTAPEEVVHSGDNEYLFNSAVDFDGERFVMLYETDDPRWTPFSFRFIESTDLRSWRPIAHAVYGTDRYVGGPSMYFVGGYYYVLYLEQRKGFYETLVTRSRDLVNWEDAPADRPFLSPDMSYKTNPALFPDVVEINASDPEMIERDGMVWVWWNGGNQAGCSDLKFAQYDGTMQQLLESFYR